ncbi:anthranilate synthase component I family protein [Sporosarcina luteola]|uniref:anthranilate synthase component I family protein n=1 Tax=Sporosarcina luteola TaxID=582850 RepID=UPI00203F7FD9|nr:anthranilate synthase component I family protein [Sporosarcina luteola]MCM3710626.1 chorismate-binding protein [Sporosarcina luteola]
MEKTSLRITEKKIEGDSLTPILIFRRLQGRHRFLLESSSQHDRSGRYSFIGVDPVKAYRGGNGRLEEFVYATGKTYLHEGDLYSLMKRLMPRIAEHGKYPFMGGAVGYIGYGAAEATAVYSDEQPDVYFNIYDTVIIFDHLQNEVTLLHTEIHPEYEKPDLYALAETITSGPIEAEKGVSVSDYRCAVSRQEFEDRVKQAKQFIENGEVEQVVLSRKLEADIVGDPFALYRRLRKKNPSPYMYYMEFSNQTVIGASPESLVRVTDGTVITNPIAGTRRRGRSEEEDKALEEELRNDPKELSEHDMLVEVSKKEMEIVCDPSSVQVSTYMETVRYEHVMHLVSEVEGTLAPGLHALDALKATLPAGTVTGSPKKIAMDIISQLEDEPRGLYGGAIGYIGLNGNIDFALTIRTMTVQDGKATVQAGAGIVKESIPALEYKETLNKARSLLEALK